MIIHEDILLRKRWELYKFLEYKGRVHRALRDGVSIEEVARQFDSLEGWLVFLGNMPLNEGLNALFTLIAGTGETKFDNTNAYIGVGDSTALEAATQGDLQASTNKLYVGMDANFPTYGTLQQAVWRASFAAAQANFAWNEVTLANGSSGAAKNFNRKVQTMGTKPNNQTWPIVLTIGAF